MKEPLVSICMPIFNGQRFLRQAIDSILNQEYEKFELVILDNQSTDETPQICKSYAEKDVRVRYILDGIKVGVHEGHNRVAQYATGKYFMLMCDDDVYDPTYLQKLVPLMEGNDQVGIAYSNYALIDPGGDCSPSMMGTFLKRTDSRFMNFTFYVRARSCVPMLFGIFRTDVYRTALPFTHVDRTTWNVDNLFMLRVLAATKVESTSEILFYYRERDRLNTFPADYPSGWLGQSWFRIRHQMKVTDGIASVIRSAPFRNWQKVILSCYSACIFVAYCTVFPVVSGLKSPVKFRAFKENSISES